MNGDYEDTVTQKSHSDRSDKKRTPKFLGKIQNMIDNNPSKSIMSIASDIGAFKFLIRLVVHENIKHFSYKMRKGQFLSQDMKDERKDHDAKLINKLKHPLRPNILCFFSDEKNVCQDQMVNPQDNCWLALSPQDVQIVMKSKYPVNIMMFGVVTSNSDVMPPIIFPHCLKLIMVGGGIKRLREVVLPWIPLRRLYIW